MEKKKKKSFLYFVVHPGQLKIVIIIGFTNWDFRNGMGLLTDRRVHHKQP